LNDQGCAEAVRKIMDLVLAEETSYGNSYINFQTSRHVFVTSR